MVLFHLKTITHKSKTQWMCQNVFGISVNPSWSLKNISQVSLLWVEKEIIMRGRGREQKKERWKKEKKEGVWVWTGDTIIQRNVTLGNFVIDHIYINLDSIAYYIPSNRNKHI